MTWEGDISRMGRLASNLGRLARVPSQASARAADSIAALITEEFDAGADPYGNSWAPLAESTVAKGRTPPPLTDTEAMRDSVQVTPRAGAGIDITILNPPAAPHQTGWRGKQGSGPARPILPSGTFPARWREAIESAVEESVDEVMQ